MDIRLQTGRINPSLELISCSSLDGGTYGSFLLIKSGEFSSETTFYFSRDSLISVFHSINKMIGGSCTTCMLGDKDDFINFQRYENGILLISGKIQSEHASAPEHDLPENKLEIKFEKQTLQFNFIISDTCLSKLFQDFSRLLDDISF